MASMEMYVEWVSTRKVKEVTEQMRATSFSKGLVSSSAGSLLGSELRASGRAEGWRPTRLPLPVRGCARYEKVRVDHEVVSQGVSLVSAVRDERWHAGEILGVEEVADTGSEATPTPTASALSERPRAQRRRREQVTSDDHERASKRGHPSAW